MTSLPRPIPKHGPVKGRWLDHQRRSRVTVFARCKGRCEAPSCAAQATDLCHLFGRRHIVAEPWASSPELCAGLCREHHNVIDRNLDVELRDRLRTQAVLRLARGRVAWRAGELSGDPIGAVRMVVDALDRQMEQM